MADQTYLDRLYNEIGQYGDRLTRTVRGPYGFSEVAKNWTTPYETPERRQEAMRLAAQQAKEEYMAQQNAGQLSLKDARESQRIREDIGKRLQALGPDTAYLAEQERLRMQAIKENYIAQQDAAQAQAQAQGYQQPAAPEPDSYDQYINQNETLLMGPQGQYAAPTREEYQKYFVENQAPPKAVPVSGAVAEMAAGAPRQAAARQQQAPERPQRPMTIREQIAMMPFAGDRYEAERKVIEKAKRAKINEAYAYADSAFKDGVAGVEGGRFIENTLKQIEANYIVPKPIEETEDFKSAKAALVEGKHADRLFMLAQTKQQLEAAKQMKTKEEKVAFLETNLPKLIQSIAAGPDAIQPAEAARIMPELNSVWQSPDQALELIVRKGIYDAFAKQPDAFIEKLGKIYNATIPAVNERTSFYHDNLGSAFKKLGAGYVTPIGVKNQGIDMTKLQQLRAGTQTTTPALSQTNPAADRPASTGPQIVPGMRFGTIVPSSMSYGSKPMPLGY